MLSAIGRRHGDPLTVRRQRGQVPDAVPPIRPQQPPALRPREPLQVHRGRTQVGHAYGAFSPRDEAIWKASVDETVEEGNKIFHDADRLGGVVAMSCDMCHPDAANTHPETYPKYQVQLGRVALLRDMINWCIENPVRGKPLEDDDPRMKALESFITAKRKGVALEYGKH